MNVLAKVRPALVAVDAGLAPARWIDCDPVADRDAAHLRTNFHDLPSHFVPEHERLGHNEIPGLAMAEVVQIGTADSPRAKRNPHHAGCQRSELPVDDAQVFRAE